MRAEELYQSLVVATQADRQGRLSSKTSPQRMVEAVCGGLWDRRWWRDVDIQWFDPPVVDDVQWRFDQGGNHLGSRIVVAADRRRQIQNGR